MPNTSSKALARIRAQYEAQQAAINARRYEQLKHLIESPVAHWSGVSERTLQILRANRDALTSQSNGAFAPVQPVNNRQFYFRHNAPAVGSLVEHELFGLGMVEGVAIAAANAGMAVPVFFDEADRTAIVFVDELEMLDGDLVGNATDYDSVLLAPSVRPVLMRVVALLLKASTTIPMQTRMQRMLTMQPLPSSLRMSSMVTLPMTTRTKPSTPIPPLV